MDKRVEREICEQVLHFSGRSEPFTRDSGGMKPAAVSIYIVAVSVWHAAAAAVRHAAKEVL